MCAVVLTYHSIVRHNLPAGLWSMMMSEQSLEEMAQLCALDRIALAKHTHNVMHNASRRLPQWNIIGAFTPEEPPLRNDSSRPPRAAGWQRA